MGIDFQKDSIIFAAVPVDRLHDLERSLFGHPAFDEVQHDIVAAADGVVATCSGSDTGACRAGYHLSRSGKG